MRRRPLLGGSLLGAAAAGSPGGLRAVGASFATMGQGPSVIDQATFKEMGLLSWLIVDLAINWGGWAVSAVLKVRRHAPRLPPSGAPGASPCACNEHGAAPAPPTRPTPTPAPTPQTPKTDKFYDMLGTGSFLALSLGAMGAAKVRHARKYVASAMVAVWALRLGSFLVARVWKVGHDSRFDEAKHKPFTFWIYWTMQVGGGGLAPRGVPPCRSRPVAGVPPPPAPPPRTP
jgi:hypothetical protein